MTRFAAFILLLLLPQHVIARHKVAGQLLGELELDRTGILIKRRTGSPSWLAGGSGWNDLQGPSQPLGENTAQTFSTEEEARNAHDSYDAMLDAEGVVHCGSASEEECKELKKEVQSYLDKEMFPDEHRMFRYVDDASKTRAAVGTQLSDMKDKLQSLVTSNSTRATASKALITYSASLAFAALGVPHPGLLVKVLDAVQDSYSAGSTAYAAFQECQEEKEGEDPLGAMKAAEVAFLDRLSKKTLISFAGMEGSALGSGMSDLLPGDAGSWQSSVDSLATQASSMASGAIAKLGLKKGKDVSEAEFEGEMKSRVESTGIGNIVKMFADDVKSMFD